MNSVPARQTGVSLVSLMIALTIGLVMLAGLFTLWFQTRRSFGNQDLLAQLQDSERVALTIAANTVQTGGYYPNDLNYATPPPATPYTPTSVFPPTSPFSTAGQFIVGTYAASASGDTLTIRYMADANTLDCLGQGLSKHPTGTLVTNEFSIDASGNFQCTVDGGTPTTIVTGASTLSVRYGVDTQGDGSVHQYMDAGAVTAGNDWSNVRSAVIRLTFDNPLYGQPGQPQTLSPVIRVVSLGQTTS